MKNRTTLRLKAIHLPILLFSLLLGCGQPMGPIEEEENPMSEFNPEQRLKDLGIQLYVPDPPVANYVLAVRAGNLVFLSGHGPRKPEGGFLIGKVGPEMDLKQAQEAARLTAISLLSSLKAEIGNLNKVKRVVKVLGMVNSNESFRDHPQVINGCSDLLVSVFEDRGRHARAAVGMGSLPFNIPVEIEMVVEVEEE